MALKLCIKFIRRGAALVARGVREPFAHSFHFAGFTFSFFFLLMLAAARKNFLKMPFSLLTKGKFHPMRINKL